MRILTMAAAMTLFIAFTFISTHGMEGTGQKRDDGTLEMTIILTPQEQEELLKQDEIPESETTSLLGDKDSKESQFTAQGLKPPKINLGRKTAYCCICSRTGEKRPMRSYGEVAATLRCVNECGEGSLKKGQCD